MRASDYSGMVRRPRKGWVVAVILAGMAVGIGASAQSTSTEGGSAPPQEAPSAVTTLTGDWFGARSKLARQGVTFDITLTMDGSKNLRGGIDTAGSVWRDLFEATLSIDTQPLLGVEGGRVFADFQNVAGQNGTTRLVGDAQKFDNIDAERRTQLAQLWYQQIALDGKLRLKVGKVDANSEFEKSDYSGEFLQSSSAFSASIFPLPTYPDPAMSVNVFVQPGAGFYGGAGVYDGSLVRGVHTGALGPKRSFHDPRDLFLIAEVGKRWGADALPGRVALGGWYDTNHFARFQGGRSAGTGGSYFLFEQTIFRPGDFGKADKGDARGVGLFVMGAPADQAVSLIDWHVGGGIEWTGPIASRNRDVAGIGVNAVHFSSGAHFPSDREVATEIFYRVQLTPWASVKPDLQYISTPGGVHRDALVATVRFLISF